MSRLGGLCAHFGDPPRVELGLFGREGSQPFEDREEVGSEVRVGFVGGFVEESTSRVIVSVIGKVSIWMGVRGITKEEPPYVIMYAEPCLIEKMQDIGVNGSLIIRCVCLRSCGWRT